MSKKRVITADVVAAEFAGGNRTIAAPRAETVITPGAWSKGSELGVRFDLEGKAAPSPTQVEESPGSCERIVDKSGLVVVRGRTVRLGRFPAAGPDRNVGLLDLVTGKDGAPMTAGIMSWGRADSFPWKLDYDEVDSVLEGALQLELDGRKFDGRAGDVFYIPKGSSVVFGTPSRVRVFYVTYPADWATAAPARPQR